ncbi:hypothetical protein JCM11251_003243 [Rhodosporidiobolus azoricus]
MDRHRYARWLIANNFVEVEMLKLKGTHGDGLRSGQLQQDGIHVSNFPTIKSILPGMVPVCAGKGNSATEKIIRAVRLHGPCILFNNITTNYFLAGLSGERSTGCFYHPSAQDKMLDLLLDNIQTASVQAIPILVSSGKALNFFLDLWRQHCIQFDPVQVVEHLPLTDGSSMPVHIDTYYVNIPGLKDAPGSLVFATDAFCQIATYGASLTARTEKDYTLLLFRSLAGNHYDTSNINFFQNSYPSIHAPDTCATKLARLVATACSIARDEPRLPSDAELMQLNNSAFLDFEQWKNRHAAKLDSKEITHGRAAAWGGLLPPELAQCSLLWPKCLMQQRASQACGDFATNSEAARAGQLNKAAAATYWTKRGRLNTILVTQWVFYLKRPRQGAKSISDFPAPPPS